MESISKIEDDPLEDIEEEDDGSLDEEDLTGEVEDETDTE